MGERSIMLHALKSRLATDVSITIGKENRIRELEPFAIVTRRFQSAGCGGLLGVLGPTRMAYGLVLALLDKTAEELQHIHIGENRS
jgi:transcriptional regulator of heat shock response